MNFSPKALLLALPLACLSYGQTGAATSPPVDKAAAYYNFSMGHLYAELAGVYGNRSEYVGKAIDHYKQALKLDPGASFLFEELTDLYIQSGRLKDAALDVEVGQFFEQEAGSRVQLQRLFVVVDGFADVFATIAVHAGQFGVQVAHRKVVVSSGFIDRR